MTHQDLLKNHMAVIVEKLPPCDMCGNDAYADVNLPEHVGWAYLCLTHYIDNHCQLGLGKGQRLLLASDLKREAENA